MLSDNKDLQTGERTSAVSDRNLSIPELRARVKGRVYTPEDEGYHQARVTLYGHPDHRPVAVVRPVDAQDVAEVIRFARETDAELAVRSGGHSAAGHSSTRDGIVLDLRDMRAMDIDLNQRTVWAEAGLTAGEVTQAAGAHGLAIGFGDTASVGIGGITTGGGVGYLVRKHGLTIDSLLAAEVVTADGVTRYTDAETEPDLFWAIRGGGGNFGVVTRFKFQLHEVPQIVGGMLFLPATPEVVAGFVAAAEAAPEELSTIANVMTAPPMPFIPAELHGQMIIMANIAYAGDVEAGLRAVEPFRKLAPPLMDMLRPMSYPEMYPPEPDMGDEHPTAVSRTLFLEHIDVNVARAILENLQASTAPMRVTQIRVLGGAAARVPADATAYPHRQAPIMLALAAFYTSPESKAHCQAWLLDFATALDQGIPGAYVNFIGDEGSARVREAYLGPTWERLTRIKAQYDPENLFRLNQNVIPAA